MMMPNLPTSDFDNYISTAVYEQCVTYVYNHMSSAPILKYVLKCAEKNALKQG